MLKNSAILLILTLSACGGGGGGGAPTGPSQYNVGGTVSGLASGATLTLTDNAGDTKSITANGSFSLAKTFISGSNYSVTIASQPSTPLQNCSVANGTGTISSAAITNIAVTCVTRTFQVSATVSGLTGSGLVLQNNATDDVAVSADGIVPFPKPIASGAAYSVTVKTAPGNPAQNCSVSNPSGTIGGADITNVAVSCATSLTEVNAQAVAIVTGRSAETVLQLASFIGEKLSYLSAHRAAQVVESCADPSKTKLGTGTYAFSDNDQNGVLSAGDTVTVTLDTCYSPSLSDYPTGTVTLTLSAPPSGSYALAFNAHAQIASFALVDRTISGALDSTYTDLETARVVSGRVSVSPLTIVGVTGGFFSQDTVTVHSAAVSKTADYVTAAYTATLAADISSQAQKGRFQISTPTPFGGPFMTYTGIYPSAGVDRIAGGATSLYLTAVNASDNQLPQVALDPDGTGNVVPLTLGLPWNGPFSGFPWWEPHAGAVYPQSQPGYSYGTLQQWGMGLLYAIPQQDAINGILGTNLSVTTPIKFFFSAPLDSTRTGFVYQPQYVAGAANIPAAVTSNGAISTLTAPLQHGFTYQLAAMQLFSTATSVPGIFNYQTLTTSNNLLADAAPSPAVAAPGQTVTLKSSRSLSTNSTIAGYSWTQLSGTPAQLANAASASASYVVPAAAVNGEGLVFQLTITDANGETDAVPVTAFVLSDLTRPFLYFRQQQNPNVGLTPETATLESPLNGTVVTAQNQNSFDFGLSTAAPLGSDSFQLLGPYNANLAVGTYQGTSTGISIIDDTRMGFTCYTPSQAFTVLDLSTGANGTVNRFAADFNEVCPGGSFPYVGSVRVNSSLPLP
jgi:hypothetical protein